MPAKRTIHVVDDDAAVRLSLERLLESMEFATVPHPTPDAFLIEAPRLVGGCVCWTSRCPALADWRCRRG